MTFFAITQQIFGESFSSSNSTEILMSPLKSYRVNGRTDTLTDSIMYSLFEYTNDLDKQKQYCLCESKHIIKNKT